ncbi:N-lysine methyltransferase SETD6 isoform X2 [Amborella trichopoda]|uniref:N-lysine methyltransferase SETD6 isoform X2 n=1 Tax=Amborella trichopoda TaxID=13333 RepID=UPI0009C0A176|nr:N-lysine methyltransferase SETD6 isoform X2 [Amborella trichopoda]|eukprot:XP_020523784.1 N-lysine methyltransferase SETD6 isoform X2 [Amborella trichopoda]
MNSSLNSSQPPLDNCEKDNSILLRLPSTAKSDPLFAKKQNMLLSRSIPLQFHIPLLAFSPPGKELNVLDEMIRAARILSLNETELYFVEDDDLGPFSPMNELESLNLVYSVINDLLHSVTGNEKEVLVALRNAIVDNIASYGTEATNGGKIKQCAPKPEMQLLEWGRSLGVKTKLQIAEFEDMGRGAIAVENMDIGDAALEIPVSIIICEDIVYDSDMFMVLKEIDGVTSETMLLLWSMREKHDASSRFKLYFESLPKTFNTGLSFGVDALSALQGTLLFEEILQAKEHIREQYDALCPALCSSHPNIFQPEFYTWDQFLWACELWYSNSMKVIFPDGKLRTCLIPVAGFLNHSLYPHILHYGKVDAEINTLRFCLSRPCNKGDQCHLSYGRFASSHLVTFYGFCPRGNNPYDVIPLDIDAPQESDLDVVDDGDRITHMVRGTWLCKNKLLNYGLPSPLLVHLRCVLLDNKNVNSPTRTQETQVSLSPYTYNSVVTVTIYIVIPIFHCF